MGVLSSYNLVASGSFDVPISLLALQLRSSYCLLKLLANELQGRNRRFSSVVTNRLTTPWVLILHDALDTQFVQPFLQRDTELAVVHDEAQYTSSHVRETIRSVGKVPTMLCVA
jgi:hypothetical protein